MQRVTAQDAQGRLIPAGYPTLEEVSVTRILCKSYVPKAAKYLWARCLLSAIAAALRHNDTLARLELLMLPKSVLRGFFEGRQEACRQG